MHRGGPNPQRSAQSAIELLDDHHLVVLADGTAARHNFANDLCARLKLLPQTQVVQIDGAAAAGFPAICGQILGDAQIGDEPPASTFSRVIAHLRAAPAEFQRRYFLWHEAHVLLDSDVNLFGRLVNALMAVAAEHEHVSVNPLVIQRAVFLGSAKLGAYAEDTKGQFCKWLDEEGEHASFWEVLSVLDRPPVMTFRLDG